MTKQKGLLLIRSNFEASKSCWFQVTMGLCFLPEVGMKSVSRYLCSEVTGFTSCSPHAPSLFDSALL